MPWLILGICVIVGLWLIFRGLKGLAPQIAAKVIVSAIVLAASGIGLYFLMASRGIGTLLFVAAFLLPMLMRLRGARQFFRNLGGPSQGKSTDVNTRYLRMSLDHDSGVLDGTVLEGAFRGQRLGEMAPDELMELLREVRVADEESATVLEAYLDRVYGASWRDNEAGAGAGDANRGSSPWGNAMTHAEARAILGVAPNATEDEIREAHRREMMKHHPDHGGSDEQATRINQAKELLLGA
jgi:hypothetical protein